MKRIFRLPNSHARIDTDLDEELAFHLDGRVEDIMAREGLSREDAEREARRRFGNYESYRREAHDIDEMILERRRKMELLDAIRRETRSAVRALRRAPTFSLIAIFTLALGLGATTTIFTLLDRVVLRPLPYPDADRLVNLATAWPKLKAGTEFGISRGQYFYFKQHSRTLADIAFYDGGIAIINGDGAHAPERATEVYASASTFSVLGITPVLGRLFTAAEEQWSAGMRLPALISYEYWQRRFGGDPPILGRAVETSDDPFVIVGVLPRGTSLPNATPDIWLPNRLLPSEPPQNNHTHSGIGLLKPGVTIDAARADIARLQNELRKAYPNVYSDGFYDRTGFAMQVRSLAEHVVGTTVTRTLWLAFAAVAFVLLIAIGNVANLFLVRIDAQRREVALRRALGADARHLAIHYLAESVILSLAAGVLALALGDMLLRLLLAIAPQSLPRLTEVSFDWRSVAFCIGVALAFGATFGLLPLTTGRVDAGVLRDGSRGTTPSKASEAVRRGLVIVQVTLAVVLLAGAGLMARSFAQLGNVRPGFDPHGVHTMSIVAPYPADTTRRAASFWHDLIRRVEATPGVIHAGATSDLPLTDHDGCSGLITDVMNSAGERGNCMPMRFVTPGYFEAMGYEARGALPTWTQVEAGAGPLVVTRAFASRFWEDADPLGHAVQPYNTSAARFPIVAVTGDVREMNLQTPASQVAYFPIVSPPSRTPWRFGGGLILVVRAPSVSTSAMVQRVRSILAEVEPKAVVADATPMEAVVAKSMAHTSFMMLMLLIAAAIALLLSAVGIYGVIAYLVGQRRGEIGVRMALGAQTSQVVAFVVRRSIGLTAVGIAVGVAVALVATRMLRSLLFEVSPTDPLVMFGTAAMLLVVAALAALGPARRAARIDPVEAMRASS
jgi:predicted permease